MPQPQVRVVGSGFSTLKFNNKEIAWLDSFSDSGQRPQNGPSRTDHEAIYELSDLSHPKEIITPYILGPGTITCTIRELWNQQVWEHLAGFDSNDHTIIDIFDKMRAMSSAITCESIIRAPGGATRGKLFHNCIVTQIPDGDDVSIGTLSVMKSLSIMYTHSTKL